MESPIAKGREEQIQGMWENLEEEVKLFRVENTMGTDEE